MWQVFLCSFILLMMQYLNVLADTKATTEDYITFIVFNVSVIICFLFSSCFHLFLCHSDRVYVLFAKLDYSGIAVMIFGNAVTTFVYIFHCHAHLMMFYITALILPFATCIYISMDPKYAKPGYHTFRTLVFIAMGCSAAIPLIHYMVLHWHLDLSTEPWIFVASLLLMAFSHLSGAYLYTMRIPERFWPGKLNYVVSIAHIDMYLLFS